MMFCVDLILPLVMSLKTNHPSTFSISVQHNGEISAIFSTASRKTCQFLLVVLGIQGLIGLWCCRGVWTYSSYMGSKGCICIQAIGMVELTVMLYSMGQTCPIFVRKSFACKERGKKVYSH